MGNRVPLGPSLIPLPLRPWWLPVSRGLAVGYVATFQVSHGSFIYVLSIAGGVGGTITLAAYGYWLREKEWYTPKWMQVMRMDNAVAYAVTGIFVLVTLALGAELLYSANVAVSDNDQGLVDMADVLEDRYGTFMSKLFIVGFFSAAFSSCPVSYTHLTLPTKA